MTEPIDTYSDQFMITTTPFGANLSFHLNTPHPEQAKVIPAERVAIIRMSNEHLKVMTIIIARQIKKMERDSGVKVEVDPRIMNSLGIGREDWDKFWEL
jgi:hypothetical protein